MKYISRGKEVFSGVRGRSIGIISMGKEVFPGVRELLGNFIWVRWGGVFPAASDIPCVELTSRHLLNNDTFPDTYIDGGYYR